MSNSQSEISKIQYGSVKHLMLLELNEQYVAEYFCIKNMSLSQVWAF